MKALKIILSTIFSIVIIALIAGFILINGIKRSALPQYEGEKILAGINGEVTSYRDSRGIPHIYADNEHDLYFAVGYIMAQERLWQMDLIRRATTGRLSEIFGKDYVRIDLFFRSLNMTAKSKQVLADTDPEIMNCLQAYSDGVNKYIIDTGNKLPPEFRILSYKPDPWKLLDLANIIGYMGWDLASGNLSSELYNYKLMKKLGFEKTSQLIPDWKADSGYVYPDFNLDSKTIKEVENLLNGFEKLKAVGITSFSGSNNWAVTGTRTENRKPILSNDMHLDFGSPGIWIQMHHVVPGKVNVTGVVIPGEPFIICGHNERIAWGMTNLSVDDIDLFAEKINPADSNQYFLNGEWKNMLVREEIIKIKGGSEQTHKLRFTHRGPVISGFRGIKDAVLSMRWSGFDMSNEVKTVYLLNRASNWDDFRSAIKSFRSISQNIVYADVDGNIGINIGGGIPVRKGSGSFIRNGETDEFDWKGYVPFENMPSSFNPDTGYVSSANNKTVSEDYPYYISNDFEMPYRINRIRQMLNEKTIFGIEDFKRMINDQHSDYAALLTPYILKIESRGDELNQLEKLALNSLKGWNYDMNMALTAPTVFEFFRISFAKNLLGDELGDLYNEITATMREYYIYRILKEGPDEWVDNVNTETKESLDDIILKSFRDCVGNLASVYEADTTKWKWGDIHKITIEHPLSNVKILDRIFKLNSKEYPVGGSYHTVSPYSYNKDFKITLGASQKHIYNTADWDESFSIIPTGNSGIPGSEFYMSQTDDYINGKVYKDAFSESAVKADAKYILVLKPGIK
jgi:penicillin amidase